MQKGTYVVIMAGGTGTRFWPYSRNSKPKQFLDILGTGRSLLQMTFDRFKKEVPVENIWIVSNETYAEIISEQLPELSSDQVLLEPFKRNTAPCIAYATYRIRKKDPDATLIVTPSDAAIFDDRAYHEAIGLAVESASHNDQLITIGIKPNRPETEYGYIQFHESADDVKRVKTFTEKPDMALARKFIDSGDFVWNAGIFVWSVSSIVNAFETIQPALASLFADGDPFYFTEGENEYIRKAYDHSKSISIDYAIMEKAENVHVVLGDFGWSDLGSWNAIHELKNKDGNGNVVEEQTLLYNCTNNYIKGQKKKLVVASDLDGYLIADFNDVLLICKKDDATRFKNLVSEVRSEKGEKYI